MLCGRRMFSTKLEFNIHLVKRIKFEVRAIFVLLKQKRVKFLVTKAIYKVWNEPFLGIKSKITIRKEIAHLDLQFFAKNVR